MQTIKVYKECAISHNILIFKYTIYIIDNLNASHIDILLALNY